MIKIAIVVCLAALAAAEADADAWYQPYGYSNWGNNWMGYNNWPMMSGYRQMNYMNGHEGHRFQSYGKREAEAEPKADADAWYQPYGYSNWNMYSNWPMNYNNWNMYSNSWNRPSYTQYRTFYHKRSADAEADADAWYQPYGYGYSNWGYNGHNMMSYWNRPYSQYSFYRYHHY